MPLTSYDFQVILPGEQRFYQQLIRKADHRFDLHLELLKAERRTR